MPSDLDLAVVAVHEGSCAHLWRVVDEDMGTNGWTQQGVHQVIREYRIQGLRDVCMYACMHGEWGG